MKLKIRIWLYIILAFLLTFELLSKQVASMNETARHVVQDPQPSTDLFYKTSDSPRDRLPENGFYPHGQKMVFAGYSGDPKRDLANGFTLAGPVYGDQMPYLESCFSNGWPVIANIGAHITFDDKDRNNYKLDADSLRRDIEKQVKKLAQNREIIWWSIQPEELRPWRAEEMEYLEIVSDAIRSNDPLSRPIYMYNPNHSDSNRLSLIAKYTDIIGKGCYVNSVGYKRERSWARWTVEQEVEAIKKTGRYNAIPILIPELCKDPEPHEYVEIRSWVRHDIYLGLVSGAKGVLIWSLFKRKGVSKTWELWYKSYAECAQELNGSQGISDIFLFGERRSDLKVVLAQGRKEEEVILGKNAKSEAASQSVSRLRNIKAPLWTAAEFVYNKNHYLFIVNSDNTPSTFTVTGWPFDSSAQYVFTGSMALLPRNAPLQLDIQAYGVVAIRFDGHKDTY